MALSLIKIGAGILPLLLIYWKKKKHEEQLVELEGRSNNVWTKFIFITNKNAECIEHLRQELPCGEKCSHTYLETIREHIRSTSTSISLCIYHVTLDSIVDELARLHSREVHVRLIGDREMAYHSSSIMRRVKDIGIPVKIQPDKTSLMHHKFFVIDEHTDNEKVWFGSLNITAQGLTNNWDHMVYTNNPSTILEFSKCFDMLWESFQDL